MSYVVDNMTGVVGKLVTSRITGECTFQPLYGERVSVIDFDAEYEPIDYCGTGTDADYFRTVDGEQVRVSFKTSRIM